MPRQQPFCGGLCGTPSKLWIYATIILLLYGFFKEFKPSEAFLTPYLLSADDGKNLTKHDINDKIYPVWTYSYLVSAFFVLLFTDFMRYNPVILIEALAYLTTRILLIWGTSVLAQQLMQVAYGVATATEVGYFSYIYSAVPIAYYEKVTGPVRAAVLLGRSLGAFAGQALYTSNLLDFYGLNYVSMACVCLAGVLALMLPWYFSLSCEHNSSQLYVNFYSESVSEPPRKSYSFLVDSVQEKLKDFVKFYTKPSLLKWSLWWAFGMCGMLQVGNYVQSLWKEINLENDDTNAVSKRYEWNGVVEGATDLLAASTALLASLLRVNWSIWGEITMGCLSLLATILLFISSYSRIIFIAYSAHVIYRSTYAFVITIASAQIAVHVDYESYGLIFGFNTFIALVLEAILAGIVNSWLELGIRVQFVVYGCYYYILTVIFVFAGVYKIAETGLFASCRQCVAAPRRDRFSSVRDSVAQYVSDSTSSESSDDEERDVGHPKIGRQSLPSVI